jgi:RNA polymerase sigma-70 factor (ECF subfamily)
MSSIEEFLPTRRSLLSRLKNWGDDDSWKRFFDTYWKLIYGAAIKSGLSDAEAQDVVQETVLCVAKNMGDFKYNPTLGSFKGWLLTLTQWRIADQYRKRQPHEGTPCEPERGGSLTPLDSLPDESVAKLEAIWDAEWQKNLMDAALARVKRKVGARQYQIFDLYVVKEWPVEDVVSTLKVSAHQVYQAKTRVSAVLRNELKALETKLV